MTLVAGLRAAAYGVPFQPVGGVHGSDLAALNGWRKLQDPYGSGQEVYVIPAIRPEVAVIHANEIDEHGNARVLGSPYWDHPLTRAAKRVPAIQGTTTSERRRLSSCQRAKRVKAASLRSRVNGCEAMKRAVLTIAANM